MLSKRFLAASLPSSEWKALRSQWLHSGQCVRCFHAGLQTQAKDGTVSDGNGKKSPHNGPKRGPTRKERAAMISNEVSMLQQGSRSASGGAATREKQPESRSGGENVSRIVQTSDKPAEVPAQSGTRAVSGTRKNATIRKALGVPYKPQALSREELLHSGEGSATIASGNFEGVIEDRLHAVVDPGQQGARNAKGTAAKFWQNQLVRFETKQQAERVTEELKQGILKPNDSLEKRLASNKFTRLPTVLEKDLSERMVKGVYDTQGLLAGTKCYDHPMVNEAAKQLLKNGTYVAQDRLRLLRKIRTLIPSPAAAKGKTPQPKATA